MAPSDPQEYNGWVRPDSSAEQYTEQYNKQIAGACFIVLYFCYAGLLGPNHCSLVYPSASVTHTRENKLSLTGLVPFLYKPQDRFGQFLLLKFSICRSRVLPEIRRKEFSRKL